MPCAASTAGRCGPARICWRNSAGGRVPLEVSLVQDDGRRVVLAQLDASRFDVGERRREVGQDERVRIVRAEKLAAHFHQVGFVALFVDRVVKLLLERIKDRWAKFQQKHSSAEWEHIFKSWRVEMVVVYLFPLHKIPYK